MLVAQIQQIVTRSFYPIDNYEGLEKLSKFKQDFVGITEIDEGHRAL